MKLLETINTLKKRDKGVATMQQSVLLRRTKDDCVITLSHQLVSFSRTRPENVQTERRNRIVYVYGIDIMIPLQNYI